MQSYTWECLKGIDIIKVNEKKEKKEIFAIKSSISKSIRKEENHNVKSVFESYPIEILYSMSTEEIQKKFEFIESTNKFGKIIRAKGITKGADGRYYQFDYTPREFKSRKIKWSNRKVISINGSELNRREIKMLFS